MVGDFPLEFPKHDGCSHSHVQPRRVFSFSDASNSWGYGTLWGNERLQHPLDGKWTQQRIAAKELLPIGLACATWGPRAAHVLVLCDNSGCPHDHSPIK